MGRAISAHLLDNDGDMVDFYLALYAAILGISIGRAFARFNMQIVGVI